MTTCSTLTCGSQNQRTFFLQISNCICYFYMIKTRAKFHQFRGPGRRISHFLPFPLFFFFPFRTLPTYNSKLQFKKHFNPPWQTGYRAARYHDITRFLPCCVDVAKCLVPGLELKLQPKAIAQALGQCVTRYDAYINKPTFHYAAVMDMLLQDFAISNALFSLTDSYKS